MPEALAKRAAAIESLPPLREIIAAHELNAQKSLGQNFLLDLNLTDKIVRRVQQKYAGDWTKVNIIEIGPGPGGLTRSLLKSGVRSVTALEFDARAVVALQSLVEASDNALSLVQADALGTDVLRLCPAPRMIVANLPYNIATPLLIGWLKQIRMDTQAFEGMALMFQKEVAERIAAPPDTKAYGRLGVISQWICATEKLMDLPPSAFTPPPKVTSSIVYFAPRKLLADAPAFELVESLTAAAFGQRRKMIRSSLKAYLPAVEALGIDPQRRAETLSVEDFVGIANF